VRILSGRPRGLRGGHDVLEGIRFTNFGEGLNNPTKYHSRPTNNELQVCVVAGNGGHVLRETTSRGRCELVCPSRTNERGGEGYCVKEGEGEEGERERERAGEV
jgi:hypothetical protein